MEPKNIQPDDKAKEIARLKTYKADPQLAVLDELVGIGKSLAALAGKETAEAEPTKFPAVQKVAIDGVNTITLKGDKGDKGEPGKSVLGTPGKDGKDGKSIVGPPGKDSVVPGPPGKDSTIPGPPGRDGKDGSPDTADDIRNKLELLPEGEKLKIEAIENLRAELDEIKKSLGKGGGSTIAYSRGQVKLYDLSAKLDGSTKTFTLPAFWRVINVYSSSFPNAFRPTTDYTTDGAAMTITFTNEITAAATLATGQTLLVEYAEP